MDSGEESPTKLSREHVFVRQTSLRVQSICNICTEPVGLISTDLRLGCQCLIHADCLGNYIKSKLGDKQSILNPLQDHEKIEVDDIIVEEAIICPYYQSKVEFNECNYKNTDAGKNDKDDKYFLTTIDLHFLVYYRVSHSQLNFLILKFFLNRPTTFILEENNKNLIQIQTNTNLE